ncbi:hypothetical protein PINS_up000206 [Pythium insidiosum]|nr:hypothetical protein PINS_up000206 [Pythium insidiosum]
MNRTSSVDQLAQAMSILLELLGDTVCVSTCSRISWSMSVAPGCPARFLIALLAFVDRASVARFAVDTTCTCLHPLVLCCERIVQGASVNFLTDTVLRQRTHVFSPATLSFTWVGAVYHVLGQSIDFYMNARTAVDILNSGLGLILNCGSLRFRLVVAYTKMCGHRTRTSEAWNTFENISERRCGVRFFDQHDWRYEVSEPLQRHAKEYAVSPFGGVTCTAAESS